MSKKLSFRDYIVPALVALSVLLMILAVLSPRSVGDTRTLAAKIEKRLQRRMQTLDRYIDRPQAKLPSDMVIYTYTDDTLRMWRGQFPILNDEVSSRVVMQRIVSPRANLDSPLSSVGESPVYLSMGPNWYLVKSREDSGTRYVAGLQIYGPQGTEGINPRLRLGPHYSIRPLTFSEGSPVYLDGAPVFKILYDSPQITVVANPVLLWIALLLLLAAGVLFVFRDRTLRRALVACGVTILACGAMYLWGRSVQTDVQLFSPTLYAGGGFLFSLGAVLLVNLAVFFCGVSIYLARRDLWKRVRSVPVAVFLCVLDGLAIAAIVVNTHFTLRSIILNSNIILELYKFGGISWYTPLVYLSVLSVLTVVPMLLQMLQPVVTRLFGWHIDMFSAPARAVLAVIIAVYMVTATSLLGFEKEQNRMEVWAGRLAVDRDINLELQLLRVEQKIESDQVISSLAGFEGSDAIIRNRIVDNYLLTVSQDCYIGVQILRNAGQQQLSERIGTLLREGTPITGASSFFCSPTADGPSRYDGIFRYATGESMVIMLLSVEQKSTDTRGYERLLSMSSSARSSISPMYSYARYQDSELRTFRGTYPYSTRMDDWMKVMVYVDGVRHYNRDGYVHFVNVITEDEAVIISRRQSRTFGYITSGLLIALMFYFLLWMLKPWKRREPGGGTYFRSRISLTLMVSLLLSLVVMASVSVTFVYRRNESNRQAIMSGRINSIQLLAQNGLRTLQQGSDLLRSSEFASLIESVSDNTGSDISVYSTDGRIILSTNPEVLDHMILGYRIEAEALDQIMVGNRRYCIIKEGKGLKHYYNMYMPVMGTDGRPCAILCSPYVETGYDFERDAAMHLASILTVFMLLFILARFFESTVLDMVFRPLNVLGSSMSHAGLGSMEHIKYDRTDEISAVVDAYNRMVDELSENSRQLAQAERDKAWSGMARQVAHEIKNPLTPMKLQIQRLIRLKQKGDPSWQDKFDEVSTVLLDHIDILTETSNEFSTFARLYSEEHTEFDLDSLLQEEISMFDNREDVRFDYIGLAGACVKGPKPQLTRVFVNLLGNAVQAVEGLSGARVLVSLRKSMRDGYYDIVVEDSGPGVSEENQSKLFTPNFTTKNGGSGLGLAISRSILESCGASIAYSRSFTLGGACFTVTYPAD